MTSIQESQPKTQPRPIGRVIRAMADGLRGPKSLSLAGFAAIIPVMIIRDVQSQLPYLRTGTSTALAAAATATLATGGVLAIASVTLLRQRRVAQQPAALTSRCSWSPRRSEPWSSSPSIATSECRAPATGHVVHRIDPLHSPVADDRFDDCRRLEQSRETSARLRAELDHLQLTRDHPQAVLNACRTELADTLNEATRPCVEELREEAREVLA